MGTPSPLRVAAVPAQSRGAAAEPAQEGTRDFLSLLGAPAPAGRAAVDTAGNKREESPGEQQPDGLSQWLAGCLPAAVATGDGETASDPSDAADALLGEGGISAEALTQVPETDALQEALLGQITAEKTAGEGKATGLLAEDLLRQLDPLLSGGKGESQPGLRLPAAELPGLMVQAAAGSSAVTVAPATTATSLEQALRANVGTPRWADELGTRLVVMSARGQQEGSLKLSPEHMGPLEVRISVHQNTANVWFGAQHADTRAALAEAMPRLRELFGEAGLSLGQAGVSEEAPRRSAAADTDFAGTDGVGDAAPADPAAASVRQLSSALLDLYA